MFATARFAGVVAIYQKLDLADATPSLPLFTKLALFFGEAGEAFVIHENMHNGLGFCDGYHLCDVGVRAVGAEQG